MHHDLTEPVSGAVVHLRVGDTLEVRLRQIGAAGYLWFVDAVPPSLRLDSDEVTRPSTSAAGAAARRCFGLTAVAAGDGDLVLRLARPWEDRPEDLRTVPVSVLD